MSMKRKVVKWLVGVVVLVAVVVVGIFLYINRGAFIERHVLPRLAAELQQPVVVDSVDFSLFNRLQMRGLRVGEADAPILKADELRVRWQLGKLLRGTIALHDVYAKDLTIDTTTEQMLQLMTLLPEPSEEPTILDLRDIQLANFNFTWRHEDASLRINSLDLNLDALRNDGPFALVVKGGAAMERGDEQVAAPDFEFSVNGRMNKDLIPVELVAKGDAPLRGQVAGLSLDDRRLILDADVSRANADATTCNAALKVMQGRQVDSEITIAGAFNEATLAGKASLNVSLPNASLLNIIGAFAGGLSFGDTRIAYQGDIEIAEQVRDITLNGEMDVRDFSVQIDGEALPGDFKPLAITGEHAVALRQSSGELELTKLRVEVEEEGRQLARIWLDQPVTVSTVGIAIADASRKATLHVRIDNLELVRFQPLLPADLPFDITTAIATTSYDVMMDSSGAFAIEGTQRVTGLQTELLETEPLTMEQALSATIKLELQAVEANISAFSLLLSSAQQEYLRMELDNVVKVRQAKDAPATISDATFTVSSPGIPLRLEPAEAGALAISSGMASALLTAEVRNLGNVVNITGHAALRDANIQSGELAWENLNLRQEFVLNLRNLLNDAMIEGEGSFTTISGPEGSTRTLALLKLDDLQASADGAKADATLNLEYLDVPGIVALLPPDLGIPELGQPRVAMLAKLAKDGEVIKLGGSLSILDVRPVLPGVADPPAPGITCDFDVRLEPEALHVELFDFEVLDNERQVVTGRLQQAAVISLAEDAGLPLIPLRITLRETDLARYQPLMPGVETLAGIVEGNLTASAGGANRRFTAEGSLDIRELRYARPGIRLTEAVTTHFSFKADLHEDDMLHLTDTRATLKSASGLELVAEVAAVLDTTQQVRQSSLQVNIPTPIDLQRLQKLIEQEPVVAQAPPVPDGQEPGESPSLPENLWLVARLQAERITYGHIVADKPVLRAELKDGVLTIDDTGLTLNGGEVKLAAMLDSKPTAPPFSAEFSVSQLDLDPFIRTFAGALPINVKGSLKNIDTGMKGQGFERQDLIQALQGEFLFEVDSIEMVQGEGMISTLMQSVILPQFDMTYEQLKFNAGSGKLSYKDQTLLVPNVTLAAANMRFVWDGRVTFRNESWIPDLKIVPFFKGELANRLLSKKLKLTQVEDGYYAAPAFRVQSFSMTNLQLAKMGVDYGVALGRIDPNIGAAAQGLDALNNLLRPGSQAEATPEQRQRQGEALLDTARDLFQRRSSDSKQEPKQAEPAPQPKQAEPATEPKKEEPKKNELEKAIENNPFLRGLRGN